MSKDKNVVLRQFADVYPEMLERFRRERVERIWKNWEQLPDAGFVATEMVRDNMRWLLDELDLRVQEIEELKRKAGSRSTGGTDG